MKITNFKQLANSVCKAGFQVHIEQWGLHFKCSLFEKDGKKWIKLPQREYEHNGEKKYEWLCWFDKNIHERLQEKILAKLEAGEYELLVEKPKEQKELEFDECPF